MFDGFEARAAREVTVKVEDALFVDHFDVFVKIRVKLVFCVS
jgi:hypothetical protein